MRRLWFPQKVTKIMIMELWVNSWQMLEGRVGVTVNLLICWRITEVQRYSAYTHYTQLYNGMSTQTYHPLKLQEQIRHILYFPMILYDPYAPPCLLHLDFPCRAQGKGSVRASNTGLPRIKHWATQQHCTIMTGSVADPDPSDTYVFGPPGSGSISQRHVCIRILPS